MARCKGVPSRATLDVHRGYLASAAYGNRSDLKERKNDDYNLVHISFSRRYLHISRTAFSSIATRCHAEHYAILHSVIVKTLSASFSCVLASLLRSCIFHFSNEDIPHFKILLYNIYTT